MAKKQFKAESKRLLDLMIHSIYTNREIFLRELISNASDAIDKLCYLSLTDENVGMSRGDFAITIKQDKEARTLTVSDNGIGIRNSLHFLHRYVKYALYVVSVFNHFIFLLFYHFPLYYLRV